TSNPGVLTVTRIAGSDRQDTAAKVSAATFAANVPVVFVATGGNFPDALAAAPAAAKQNGPLLLVDRDSMSQPVRDELRRLKPSKIVVVGSDLSVSERLATELAAYAKTGEVQRIGGVDRYDTAAQLVEAAFPKGSSQAWLATGEKFPDALAAAAAAGSVRAPVLLINGGQSTVDDRTRSLVRGLGVKKLTIAGDPLSVSTGIETSFGITPVRIGGTDRYDTSVLLNRDAFTAASTVYLATGEKFPDALAGANAAGFTRNPLYTVKPDCVPQAVLDDIDDLGATKVVLLGGPNTLSEGVASLTACR
ncbi:cell wall-binding repeat-containing protein, partial [Rathayibacter sp. ZW T2_19]